MTVIFILSIACIIAHRVGRNAAWFDAAILHAVCWAIAVGTYLVFREELIEPTDRSLIVVAAGIIFFSAGVWIGASISSVDNTPLLTTPRQAFPFWAIIVGSAFAAVLLRASQMVSSDNQMPWLLAVRVASSEPGRGFGFTGYLANVGFAAAFVCILLARSRVTGAIAIVAAVLAVGTAFLLTGRTFLILVATIITVAGITRRCVKPIILIAGAIIVAALLGTVTVLQARAATSAGGLIAALRYEWLHYVPVGLAAFSIEVRDLPALQWGVNMFRTPFAVLKALGFDVPVVSIVRPYVPVPFMTNVYTAFSPYYKDFGIIGVGAAFGIFGLLTGHAQVKAQGGHPVYVMLFAILLYALAMQFFQDQYLTLASQWAQLLLFTFLLILPLHRRR